MKRSIRTDYRHWLSELLKIRRRRNVRYSMRAFARDLGVSQSTLQGVLAKKRHLSRKSVLRIVEQLHLSHEDAQLILTQTGHLDERTKEDFAEIDDRHLKIVSEWFYLAILNLAKLPQNRSAPSWIATRLGIDREQAQTARDDLCSLGFISCKGGKMHRLHPSITTSPDIPSEAIRKHLSQILELADQSLSYTPVTQREFGFTTMAIERSRLPKAKEMIRTFRRKLARYLESDNPDDVYTFSAQLFPIKENR